MIFEELIMKVPDVDVHFFSCELLAGIEGGGNMPFGSLLIFVVSFWSHHVSGLNLLLLQTANTHGF